MSLGWKVWAATEKEVHVGNQYPIDTVELGEYEGNSKSLNAILSGLTNNVFTKVMQCTYPKQAWDKLKIIYEGESKVKESKLQTYKDQFESLKMREEENIGKYLLCVDEVVNAIRGLGGKLKEKEVVSKILRTLPMRYDSNVSTLEERDELKKVTQMSCMEFSLLMR